MSLRVTRLDVEVLGRGDGKLRVTQLAVEVLGQASAEYNVSADNSLSLTQTAGSGVVTRSATSTLAVSQSAIGTLGAIEVEAVSTLVATQSAVRNNLPQRNATSTISLIDVATSGHWFASALSELAVSDIADRADTYVLFALDTLAITQDATCTNLHVYATSQLDLESFADHNVKARSANSALSLAQEALGERVLVVTSVLDLVQSATQGKISVFGESQLDLVQEARNTNIKLVASSADLDLVQEATSNIKMLSVTSTLVLDHSHHVTRPWYATATSELQSVEQVFDLDTFSFIDVITGLTDSASAQLDGPRSVSHTISFSQVATQSLVQSDAIAADAESEITLTQDARLSIQEAAISAIVFTQTATAVLSEPATSTLSLSQTASVNVVRGAIAATSVLEIKQAIAYLLDRTDTLCSYSPFVGDSSDPNAPTPPPATYPAAGGTPGFRLQYPESGPVTDELLLRAPNLGNVDRMSMTRINRETRGGTLIIYADPIWPKVETLLLSFSGLSADESQDLLDWMETYLGQGIRLIDWEDRVWRGVIVNPQDPVVQDGKGCRYTASFEFEGTKV